MAPSGCRLRESVENASCSCSIPTDIKGAGESVCFLELWSAKGLLYLFVLAVLGQSRTKGVVLIWASARN